MTATKVMVGIPKGQFCVFSATEFEDLRRADGGDDDFISKGHGIPSRKKFDFYAFTSHVVQKEELLRRIRRSYKRFIFIQMTE